MVWCTRGGVRVGVPGWVMEAVPSRTPDPVPDTVLSHALPWRLAYTRLSYVDVWLRLKDAKTPVPAHSSEDTRRPARAATRDLRTLEIHDEVGFSLG